MITYGESNFVGAKGGQSRGMCVLLWTNGDVGENTNSYSSFQDPLLPPSLSRESGFGYSANSKPQNAKKATREELRLHLFCEPVVDSRVFDARHGGNIQFVEIPTAKDDARNVFHGHANAPVNAAVRCIADQISGDDLRIPQVTLLVHRRTIRYAWIISERSENAFVGKRSPANVVVVSPDLPLKAVGQVERLIIRAPAWAVCADDAILHLCDAQVGIKAPEAANLQFLLVVHAAGKEPAHSVTLAIVEARPRLLGIHEVNQFELSTPEIKKVKAIVEGEHGASSAPERHRPDIVGQEPVFNLAGGWVEPPDRGPANAPPGAVNPIESTFLHVPDRAFAKMILALQDTLAFNHPFFLSKVASINNSGRC